jgi:hypothetical protein
VQDKSVGFKIVLWRSDSNHVCGMVPTESLQSLDAKLTPERLLQTFGSTVPEWLAEPLCEQLNGQASSSFGSIIRCTPMHGPGNVVLIGDAAHAVTSALGQGCNMALEDVRVLGETLEECMEQGPGSIADVSQQYAAARAADVDALQRLELMAALTYGGGGKEAGGVSWTELLHARVALGATTLVGVVQWKAMPEQYKTLPLFAKLYDQDTRYSEVLAYVNVIGGAAYVLLSALGGIMAYNLAQAASQLGV